MQANSLPKTRSDRPGSLPFTLPDLRAAIPAHCFVPSTARSLAYAALDLGLVAALYILMAALPMGWLRPLFWFALGTLFWALFVVGHDCGHGSFSRSKKLNDIVGHLCHSPILVPYHGWRISHRTHHANTGHVENDESWHPISETQYRQMPWYERWLRFHLPLMAYPIYLFKRSPGKQGSHFLPDSPLFQANERRDVLTSTFWWGAMVAFLGGLAVTQGPLFVLDYYGVPYLIFVVWLDLVTYLHHTEADIPWYRGADWSYLKGALSTIDRDYGIFNPIHHHIGTHVAHHLFANIPHYHLQEATAALIPVLGPYYRKATVPIWSSFFRSVRQCYVVPDRGSPVFYQRPPTTNP